MPKVTDIVQLQLKARDIRIDVLRALTAANSGHPGGSLGMADVFTALFFNVANIKPKQPTWLERDRIVLSNGHICPVLYATMAHAGFFDSAELMTLRKFGARLQGHPHRLELPGLETSSGPLGSGTSQAAGMALAFKIDKTPQHVWCVVSDGEQNEGNTWEAVLFAAAKQLNNLTVIMDRNNIQIDGNTEDIMPLDSIVDKYRAFNWNVLDIDGHDLAAIIEACEQSKREQHRPTLIVANVIPGKGVSFMERQYAWHGKAPNAEQLEQALEELKSL